MTYNKIVSFEPNRFIKITDTKAIAEYTKYLVACAKSGYVLDDNNQVKTVAEWLETEI